tara:strand:+ start:148 stop:285 length:138 start_codon:yes stop_codon:yes gene_type:complete
MGRRRMIDNKEKKFLKACQSDFACGNYFYHTKYRYCEICRTKDWC